MRSLLIRSAQLLGITFFAALLSGCNSKLNDYYTLAKLVMEDQSITLTKAQLKERENKNYIQISVNDRSSVLLQLTFEDGDDHYWRSGDGVLLRLNRGVITQTNGLDSDLYYTSQPLPDTALTMAALSTSWQRILDVNNVGYGLNVRSVFEMQGEKQLPVFGDYLPVKVVAETVHFPSTSPFVTFNRSWHNYYYYAGDELVGTTQKLTPDGDTYDMVFLNRALAALDNSESS